MNHQKLISLTALLCITAFSYSQTKSKQDKNDPSKPKLIIGIVVDQMRYDYVYRYWNKFGDDGFKRLMNEGYSMRNAHYNYVPTFTGPGHACIYTGTTPAINGIIGNDWYEKTKNDTVYCVDDKTVNTVGSTTDAGKMSPHNLLTSTITDELRYSTNFASKTIGIALKDRGAILPAGHAATAAYWYDGKDGNWISSTYYMTSLPSWASKFNDDKLSDKYLNQTWNTLLPIDQYTESTTDDSPYEEPFAGESKPIFPHSFPYLKKDNFELVRKSPWGNSITKDFAIATIKGENMGKNATTDFLAVSFSSTDYVGHQFGTNSIEIEDTYLRLDKDIAELLKFVDTWIGKDNTLIFLTADHGAVPNPQYLHDNKMIGGYMDASDIKSYLNKALNNTYGDGKWVMCFTDDQVYLNHDLINSKKLNDDDVAQKTAEILLNYDGVANTVTAKQLRDGDYKSPQLSLWQKGYNAKLSGDVFVINEPAVIENKKTGTTHGASYEYDTHVPLFFYGWHIPHGSSAEPVHTEDIAPTISDMINIIYPNGCTGKPFTDLIK